jgi:hypothetical protein
MELSLSYKYVNFSFKQGWFEDDPQAAWGWNGIYITEALQDAAL